MRAIEFFDLVRKYESLFVSEMQECRFLKFGLAHIPKESCSHQAVLGVVSFGQRGMRVRQP